MTRILHLSDLHFGPPYLPRVGKSILKLAARLELDAVVISGDFTQRATQQQFEAARVFMDQLPAVPRLVVPGNHDVGLYRVWERLVKPYELYQHHISQELDVALEVNDVMLVGLNSTSPRRAISNGRIHREQLAFAVKAFHGVPDGTARIIVSHHHFTPAPDYLRDQTMPKSKRAIDRFLDLGVEMILGGHLHRAYIGNSLDFYPADHRNHGIIVVQCGTSTSRRGRGREREKNSFNLIDVDADQFRVTHYMYFDRVDDFVPQSQHRFPRHHLGLEDLDRSARRAKLMATEEGAAGSPEFLE